MTDLLKAFDGKNFYPALLIKRTAHAATVQLCDPDGKLRGAEMTRIIDDFYGEPTVEVDHSLTVYLDSLYDHNFAMSNNHG